MHCPVGRLMSNVYCCIFYDGAILFSALSDKFNEFYFRIYVWYFSILWWQITHLINDALTICLFDCFEY